MSILSRRTMRAVQAGSSGVATLRTPVKREIAFQLVSSAENSTLNWQTAYRYIEDIADGRGYTAGLIGFCSGTGDMLELIQYYTQIAPSNNLAQYITALENLVGSDQHTGLDPNFVGDWENAADNDSLFRQAQDHERDRIYFDPAVDQAIADGLGILGQFIYYDCLVMHGPGNDSLSFGGIRNNAISGYSSPSMGGNETTYLHEFLDTRRAAMISGGWGNTDRIDMAQRVFLNANNLDLHTPLNWSVYGDNYSIPTDPPV